MQIYTNEAECEICGEPGPCTQDTATAAWFVGSKITHRDPTVCIENIKAKAAKEKAKAEAEAQYS